jgi:hypothetical protein
MGTHPKICGDASAGESRHAIWSEFGETRGAAGVNGDNGFWRQLGP